MLQNPDQASAQISVTRESIAEGINEFDLTWSYQSHLTEALRQYEGHCWHKLPYEWDVFLDLGPIKLVAAPGQISEIDQSVYLYT